MSNFYDDFDEIDKLILETRTRVIAKLDAATDFDAVLADIYAQAGGADTPQALGVFTDPVDGRELDEVRGGVEAVCDHIDMLYAVLQAAAESKEKSPLMGALFLGTSRRTLLRLRNDLTGRRLSKSDALRLIGNIEHNLREADTVLRTQQGLSLDEALHHRIGELMALGGDIAGQVRILREKVVQLFDEAADPAALTPAPHG